MMLEIMPSDLKHIKSKQGIRSGMKTLTAIGCFSRIVESNQEVENNVENF